MVFIAVYTFICRVVPIRYTVLKCFHGSLYSHFNRKMPELFGNVMECILKRLFEGEVNTDLQVLN
jgi:hypothetical protein